MQITRVDVILTQAVLPTYRVEFSGGGQFECSKTLGIIIYHLCL